MRKFVPRPLICFSCGKYGHGSKACKEKEKCLRCGSDRHSGGCDAKCLHCGTSDHSCTNKKCPKWTEESEICKIKAERDVSFYQARQIWTKEKNANSRQRNVAGEAPMFSTVTHKNLAPETKTNYETNLKYLKKVEKLTDLVTSLVDKISQLVG